MSDLEKRLDQIEQKIDASTRMPPPYYDTSAQQNRNDEIDLRELWKVLWVGKWWIIGITFLFAVAGVLYALSLPNMYASTGVYAPAQKEGSSGVGGQLSGLASLAGVSLGGGERNDIDQAMVLLTSWPFLEEIINKYELKPLVMGVKGWERDAKRLVWDEETYDPSTKAWLREPPKGQEAEPSSYETYQKFNEMLTANFDEKSAMLNIAVEYYSPSIAQEWVEILVAEINEAFRARDMAESKSNIEYLERKIVQTSIAEMQAVFYGMVESQTRTLMLAEVDEQYLFKQVVEPMVSERKSKPKRALLCVLFFVLGGFVSVFVVLAKHFLLPRN